MPHLLTTTWVDDFAVDNFYPGRYHTSNDEFRLQVLQENLLVPGVGLVASQDPSLFGDRDGWYDSEAIIPDIIISLEVRAKWHGASGQDGFVGVDIMEPGSGNLVTGPLASVNYNGGVPYAYFSGAGVGPDTPGYTVDSVHGWSGVPFDPATDAGEVRATIRPDMTGTVSLYLGGALVVSADFTSVDSPQLAANLSSIIGFAPGWSGFYGGGDFTLSEIGWTMVTDPPGPGPAPPQPQAPPIPPEGIIQIGRISGGTVRIQEARSGRVLR